MIILICGGSASGKSAYAEEVICSLQEEHRVYLATMQPFGKEAQNKIERHKNLREGKGFTTIEAQVDLKNLRLHAESAVLLEDLTNLAANEFFREDRPAKSVEELSKELLQLAGTVRHLVLVGGDLFSDGLIYESKTSEYLAYLAQLQIALGAAADQVTEVVYGIPIPI